MALNCSAPDDGNMNLLAKVGTPEQKHKWLRPIVDGTVRSSFVMTEPHPGGGSDPGMMLTRAEKRNDRYTSPGIMVHHRRTRCRAFHLVARTSDEPRRADRLSVSQGSAGLADRAAHPNDGTGKARRPLRTRIRRSGNPVENVLMNVGDGLRATQIRLGPARLTHCMRWLGLAKRCMEIAQDYVERA